MITLFNFYIHVDDMIFCDYRVDFKGGFARVEIDFFPISNVYTVT